MADRRWVKGEEGSPSQLRAGMLVNCLGVINLAGTGADCQRMVIIRMVIIKIKVG